MDPFLRGSDMLQNPGSQRQFKEWCFLLEDDKLTPEIMVIRKPTVLKKAGMLDFQGKKNQ